MNSLKTANSAQYETLQSEIASGSKANEETADYQYEEFEHPDG